MNDLVMWPREGLVLGCRYRLDERIGDGGFGEVWRATDIRVGSPVAIKTLSTRVLPSERHTHGVRLRNEAMLAKRVDCPHVVRVLECAHSLAVGPYLVMRLAAGPDLLQHLTRLGRLPPTKTASVVAQLCVALDALHDVGVIHMDVKPGNVMLSTRDGHPHATLVDFGIACETGDANVAGLAGTPAYMCPERLLGLPLDAAQVDLWSLAVVAYQCLTGRLPFDDSALGNLCVSVEAGSFLPPRALRSDIPRKLDAWCVKALARKPSQRFHSAEEMREALIEASAPFALGAERASGTWPVACAALSA